MHKTGLTSEYAPNVSEENFINLKETIRNDLLPLFENIITSILGIKRLPVAKLRNIVQGITYNLNNRYDKLKDPNYFIQNALAFITTVDSVLKQTDILSDLKEDFKCQNKDYCLPTACILEHTQLLQRLFFDSCILIQQAMDFKEIDNPAYCGTSATNPLHMMSGELHSILYGYHTPLSCRKFRIHPAIPTLRIMIEVKIRNAFGIVGLQNKQTGALEPIPLSKIFNAVNKYVKNGDVIFNNIEYANLKKIYTWTNIYIHSGLKSYTWYPFIFHMYLHDFFDAMNIQLPNNRWSSKSGIQIKKDKLYKIQQDIESHYRLISFDEQRWLESVLI